MPSSVVTQVAEIKNLRNHPNADRLEICEVGGWQLVCGKDLYEEGERVVYITPDSLITETLADILEIKQHLSSVKNPDGTFVTNEKGEVMLRVRQAKLRGEPSFGTTIPTDVMQNTYGIDINKIPLGANLATAVGNPLGIMKYEPAMKSSAGDAEVDHPLFPKYTNIENIRNYPNLIQNDERVILTEKIHGQNLRIGKIEGQYMAGSHGTRRKFPENLKNNAFWYPLETESVKNLLNEVGNKHKQVILFGESYGNIQKNYSYDAKNTTNFRAFDLLVDGKYLNYIDFCSLCEQFGVNKVPSIGTVPYAYDSVVKLVENHKTSTLSTTHPMEGCVIRPELEREDSRLGRIILKYISNSYMFDKNKSDYTEI